MAEIRSPLTACLRPGSHGAVPSQGTPLVLSECGPGALVQLAGWDDFTEAAAAALSVLGFDCPGDYGTVIASDFALGFRVSPGKLLVRHTDAAALAVALASLDPARVATLDLSHARWLIGIEGPALEDLLARLAPVDFSLPEFPAGSFVQTGVHHIGVLIHRVSAQRVEIYVPVTWVATLWDLACDTAASFGYSVEEGDI